MNEDGKPAPESAEATTQQPAPVGGVFRRRLINILLGTSLGAWTTSVAYPVVRYLFPPEGPPVRERSVQVGKVGDFERNSGKLFRIANKPGLLIRTKGGQFRAFVAICTHLDCTVQFKGDEGVIWCACHNGRYDLQGKNISGPPPRPLDALEVTIKTDEVHVSLPG